MQIGLALGIEDVSGVVTGPEAVGDDVVKPELKGLIDLDVPDTTFDDSLVRELAGGVELALAEVGAAFPDGAEMVSSPV